MVCKEMAAGVSVRRMAGVAMVPGGVQSRGLERVVLMRPISKKKIDHVM